MNRREAIRQTALLSGGVVSTSIASSILLGSCQPTGKLDWEPTFFSPWEAKMVSSISDIILPASDTPGALDVHVPEFVDLMANDCLTEKEQTTFKGGLKFLWDKFAKMQGGSFAEESLEKQTEFIGVIDKDSFDGGENLEAYKLLKQLILLGYFTSEKVMTGQLNYHSIPGRYDACIAYDGKGVYCDNNVEGRL